MSPAISRERMGVSRDTAGGTPKGTSKKDDLQQFSIEVEQVFYAIPISKSPEFGTLAQTGRITYSERISCDKDVPLAMVVAVA
jgi:hypothetical protein